MSGEFAGASRNSPCPCGSGRRFKDCHGALDARTPPTLDAGAPPPPARSSYRAPGDEWGRLSEEERDACGELMERALAHQLADRLDAAADDYGAVLSRAPLTHDALHMAGVIALARKNLDEAERLIAAAMALRPSYPAIEHNLQLVHDARLAALRAQPEELCERALPIMVELALRPRGATPSPPAAWRAGDARAGLHLIGRAHGGDDDECWLLRRLAELLARMGPCVWTVDDQGPAPSQTLGLRRIAAEAGAVPRGGTHVYVGMNLGDARRMERADADRVLAVCFGAPPSVYLDQLRAIARDGARAVELVFPSCALAARFGSGHVVIPPPVGTTAAPACDAEDASRAPHESPAAEWAVGIVGQRRHTFTDADDGEFLSALVKCAGRLHVYDPGRLRYALGRDARVHAFPRRPGALADYMATLSCFVHRTTRWWDESLEREVFAALAAGVPVLCPQASLYAEYIENGVDGLLYGSPAEAVAQVEALRRSPAHAAALGAAARARIERLTAPDILRQRWTALIAGTDSPPAAPRIAWQSNLEISR